MPNVLNIWRDSSGRARAVFVGCLGMASILFTLAPVWDRDAGAAITDLDYGPFAGTAGTAVGFSVPECIESGLTGVPDVAFEINTAAVNNPATTADESRRDQQGFNFQADGIYGDDGVNDPPYVAPPEFDFLEPPPSQEGPRYDVTVTCLTADGSDADSLPDYSTRTVEDGFLYLRGTTSSTAGSSTTSTTSGATTTSTTTGATTTSTSGATTTSTTGGATTTSTSGATTTSTTAGATTTSTTSGATTTSTSGATTTSTTTGATTTSTAGATTTSTTTGASTTSTSAPASTTSTTAGATTSSTAGGSTTSTSGGTSSSSTVASACTVADTTLTLGQAFGVSCGGFGPESSVAVDLLSTPVRLATLTANASGEAIGTVQVPINTAAGTHEVRFTGTAADGTALVRSVSVTVSRALPRTGGDSWTLLRYSLLLCGIGLLAMGRSQILRAR